LAVCVTFITAFVLARLLSPGERGVVGKITTLIALGVGIGSLSLPIYAIRQSLNENLNITSVVCSVQMLSIRSAFVTSFFLSVYLMVSGAVDFPTFASTAMLLVILVEFRKGLLVSVASRENNLATISLSRIVAPVSYLCFLLISYLLFNITPRSVIACFALSQLAAFLPLFLAFRQLECFDYGVKPSSSKPPCWGAIFTLHLNSCVTFVNNQLDKILVTFLLPNGPAGQYFLAYALNSVPNLVLQPIIMQLLGTDEFTKRTTSGTHQSKNFLSLALVYAVALIASIFGYYYFGYLVLDHLFGNSYSNGMNTVMKILPFIVCIGTFKQLLLSALTVAKRDKLVFIGEVLQLLGVGAGLIYWQPSDLDRLLVVLLVALSFSAIYYVIALVITQRNSFLKDG